MLRARWRATLVRHFTRPQPERERGRGDLALAIEQASDDPMLTCSRRAPPRPCAALAVLFWAGGWLSLLITVRLLVGAVPLYRRAGTRSEASALDYQRRRAVLESRQLELLHHTTELRALGAVEYGANEIAAISDSEHAIAMRAIRVALESSFVTEFLSGVSIGLVAMVVGFALLGGRITLEHALIAVLVTSEIFTHVRRFGVEFHRREDSQRSLECWTTPTRPMTRVAASYWSRRELVTAANERPICFTLAPGQSLLVTGPSGVGQDDVVATRCWVGATPSGGVVTYTDAAIGHVSVESALVSGIAARQSHARSARYRTTRSAHAFRHSDSRDLDSTTSRPHCLADGKGISTGEKVRLVLARALLAEPEVSGHRRRGRGAGRRRADGSCATCSDATALARRRSRRPSTRHSSSTSPLRIELAP